MQYYYEMYSSPQVEDSENNSSPQVGGLRNTGIFSIPQKLDALVKRLNTTQTGIIASVFLWIHPKHTLPSGLSV